MVKITALSIKEFIENNNLEFLPTQNKLSLAIINRIYRKMMFGIKFDEIKVNENKIIDGHHRYISSKLANIIVENINYPKTNATILYDWSQVLFVDEEWDTDNKILYLNELDAEFNNISIEKIIEITK